MKTQQQPCLSEHPGRIPLPAPYLEQSRRHFTLSWVGSVRSPQPQVCIVPASDRLTTGEFQRVGLSGSLWS